MEIDNANTLPVASASVSDSNNTLGIPTASLPAGESEEPNRPTLPNMRIEWALEMTDTGCNGFISFEESFRSHECSLGL